MMYRRHNLRVSGSSVTFFSPSPRMNNSNLGIMLSSSSGLASRRPFPDEYIEDMVPVEYGGLRVI